MTKTLTEQWHEGTLEERQYYFKTNGIIRIGTPFGKNMVLSTDESYVDEDEVEEVLAPVPSYDEWQSYDKCADMLIDVNKKWHKTIVENKKLKKQLAIATKALKKMAKDNFQCAEQALEEIELREVK